MASNAAGIEVIEVIELSDLWQVCGGVDKQTAAAQAALDQATSAVENMAKKLAPQDSGMTDALLQLISNRRSGPGPSSAPALPPTSTLTR